MTFGGRLWERQGSDLDDRKNRCHQQTRSHSPGQDYPVDLSPHPLCYRGLPTREAQRPWSTVPTETVVCPAFLLAWACLALICSCLGYPGFRGPGRGRHSVRGSCGPLAKAEIGQVKRQEQHLWGDFQAGSIPQVPERLSEVAGRKQTSCVHPGNTSDAGKHGVGLHVGERPRATAGHGKC